MINSVIKQLKVFMALYLLWRKRKSILYPLLDPPTHSLSLLSAWSVGRESIVFKFLRVQQRQSLPLGGNILRTTWLSFRRVPAAPPRTPGCSSLLFTLSFLTLNFSISKEYTKRSRSIFSMISLGYFQ